MPQQKFFPASVLLVGAGKMGGALLASWLGAGLEAQRITVVEPDSVRRKTLVKETGVNVAESAATAPPAECVVIAVKPQMLDELMPQLATRGAGAFILSIVAGKTVAYFAKYLNNAPVVRAMPNTPALVSAGISALCASASVSETQKAQATALLKAAGEIVWLEDESLMDAVTAISGSGPAYVFLLMEALMGAGKDQGLPEEICKQLVQHTVLGSAKLALQSSDSIEKLRENVTSPGGTTEAALNVLMAGGKFQSLVQEAVKQAVARAKELA